MNPAPAQLFAGVRLSVASWTAAPQAPLSLGFSRQEHWSGLPCASPGDLPNPGIKPGLPLCKRILYQLSHQGSPRLERVAYPSSKGSSPPRGQTGVSCVAGRFFTSREKKENITQRRKAFTIFKCASRGTTQAS